MMPLFVTAQKSVINYIQSQTSEELPSKDSMPTNWIILVGFINNPLVVTLSCQN